jgi:hypothetical protein
MVLGMRSFQWEAGTIPQIRITASKKLLSNVPHLIEQFYPCIDQNLNNIDTLHLIFRSKG